jgi:hypothetical protein
VEFVATSLLRFFCRLFLFFGGDLTRHESSGVIETWLNQARLSRGHFMHHAFLVNFLLTLEESFFHQLEKFGISNLSNLTNFPLFQYVR